ncbi:TetR/AcrR family transcriptional regulator [Rudanella lutea]|uniref:TetR/AcrR family transcriptional regulator n=1 Tax=Rudanella lutea TaxID=451374 RepID=UPI00035E2A1E|nr:TetR family transcriptional regulator C-terminal domain-containing protein [Rudanella lutea]
METLEKIRKAYTEYVLENGIQPPSVYQFAKKLKLPEAEFYNHYSSFDAIEADIWLAFFTEARQTVEADETYQTYSVREKLLAFYYTWIELLKAQRSFVVYSYGRVRGQMTAPDGGLMSGPTRPGSRIALARMRARGPMASGSRTLFPFKDAFYDFAKDLLAEGRESREVEQRPFVTNRYPDALWLQTLYILDFWVRDVSRNFEQTDTAIEKTVNTAFDLIGRSPLDSVFDLAKFIYQTK